MSAKPEFRHEAPAAVETSVSRSKDFFDWVGADAQIITNAIVNTVIDGIVLIDSKGSMQFANPATERIFGYTLSELLGRNVKMLMSEPHQSHHDGYLDNYKRTGRAQIMGVGREVMGRAKDGREVPIDLSVVETHIGGNQYFVGLMRDVTERHESEQATRRSVGVHRAINNALDGFISANLWTKKDVYDNILNSLIDLTDSDFGFIGEIHFTEQGLPFLRTQAITDISWSIETRALYKDNVRNGLEFYNLNTLFGATIRSGEPVISNDPMNDHRSGGLPHGHPPLTSYMGLPIYAGSRFVGMAGVANRKDGYDEDIMDGVRPFVSTIGSVVAGFQNLASRQQAEQDLYRAQEKLRVMATHDQLTGIYNRTAVLEAIENGLVARKENGAPVSVLFIDVDHFKQVNDTYGHDAGDALLVALTSVITETLRPTDAFGHYRGEEFVLHLQNCNANAACDIAERIRAQINEHKFKLSEEEMEAKISISIGVSSTDFGDETVDELIKTGDVALYKAKEQGRNSVVLGKPRDRSS